MNSDNPYQSPNAASKSASNYDDMRIKYLFVNLTYPAYVRLQIALVAAWIIGAALLFFFARDSSVWLLKNGWWLCLVIGFAEVGEAVVAIGKAKQAYDAGNRADS